MGTTGIYRIDLKNLFLSTTYNFDYLLDNDFFESVDGAEVRKGKLNVSLSVTRVSTFFEFDFQIRGEVTVICDRCLDELEIPVETTNRLCVTFGEMFTEISDEQIIVSAEEGFIDIDWYIYEFIALAIPLKHVHAIGDCNEVMASKLRELCVDVTDENDDTASGNSRRPVDPRWDALRDLLEGN